MFYFYLFSDLKSIIICGIESHVCVQGTVLDFLSKEYDVHVVADAVSSRSMVDRLVTSINLTTSSPLIYTI